MIILLSATDRL